LALEWLLTYASPKSAAVLLYLHMSGLGPLLGSGFWLMASERFDPRTAKRRFGQIQGAGTAGGLVGGLMAERVGALFGIAALLPALALLNFLCAWVVRRLAREGGTRDRVEAGSDLVPIAPRSGFRVLAEAPYLRNVAALVVVGTMSTALLDYAFKAEAVGQFGQGNGLIRFFAVYYAVISLVTFSTQTFASRPALERFGLATAASTPAAASLFGAAGSLLAPGLPSIAITRGGESVLRSALFRASYEQFYTPIPPAEKRVAKAIIDVGFDRFGEVMGAAFVGIVLLVLPSSPSVVIVILSAVIVSSAIAVLIARRLNRSYVETLENSLLSRAVEIDLSEIVDLTTRSTVLRTLAQSRGSMDADIQPMVSSRVTDRDSRIRDDELQKIVRLRSRDRREILSVLRGEESLKPALVPHVIGLLARDDVAQDAVRALSKVAEGHVGELVDRLIDPNEDFAVRRRLPRVFSVCVSQRAVDGLMLGLDDLRFEVRFQCGRSLAAIVEKSPIARIDSDRVRAVVLREVAVSRSVWESRRLLDQVEAGEEASFTAELVRHRADQSLVHVFTLLSLILPREPLLVAVRGLHSEDENLQATALEYLERILPPAIRDGLWPFLEDRGRSGLRGRSRQTSSGRISRS
jgi:hypothetical protein